MASPAVEVNDKGFGFSPFPHELSRDPSISLQAKGLFSVYGSFVGIANPQAWPSEKTLCGLCGGISNRTLHKYKRELLTAGWISQEQRRRENGLFSSLLITRYFHPSMNPHWKPIPTGCKKTACGKTACRKMGGQEQKTVSPINKKHTTTSEPPAKPDPAGDQKQQRVSILEAIKNFTPTQHQLQAIDWHVQAAKKRGGLQNEVGYRLTLTRAAARGELDTSTYDRWLQAEQGRKEAQTAAIHQVERYQQEYEADPLTPEAAAELRREHAELYRRLGIAIPAESEAMGAHS